ncbi:blastula protease 10-like [Saccostrea cucullata]|uniref:blastula protease 10-like n=1 Tax=Saccostrea cuccullata TaxID=36930 RepID=UPI002ED65A89
MVLIFLLVQLSFIALSPGAPMAGAGIGLHNFFNVYIGMSPPRYVYSSSNQPKVQIVRQQPDDERHPKPWTFESDMTLTPSQRMAINRDIFRRRMGIPNRKRKIVSDERYYWPNGIIPFETKNLEFTVSSDLNTAINMWEKLTCIRFVGRTRTNQKQYRDYVIIQQTYDGCESNVGRIGGQQVVNVSNGCGAGSIAHELGHTFGFVHEQSRSDRDQHILIVDNNIIPGTEKNFQKYSNKKVYTYDLSYDIGSLMHYSDKAFSRDGQSKTILARDTLVQSWMGQRDGPSFLDIKLANEAYQCDRHCRTNFVCQNGGFIGPNCNCICPYGVSGFTCDEVAPSTPNCGGTFRKENGTILSPNYPNDYYSNAECHWLIEGPFEFLKLTIRDFHSESEYDVLDIRVYGPERVGQMISGNNIGEKIIYFSSNKLLLHFTSDQNSNFRGFRIDYTSIHSIDIDRHH